MAFVPASSIKPKRHGLLRRLLGDNKGVAAIETAMVLPLVIWLIMGILEMGIVFHISSLANYAANESARLGKTGNFYGSNDREQLVYSTMRDYLDIWVRNPEDLELSSQSYGDFNDFNAQGVRGAGTSGDIVMYKVIYKWKIFTPLFAQAVGDNGVLNITSRVIMKNENFN